MIKFGYLEGYNKFNQISFASLVEQKQYFDNLVTYSFDAYYPPYFTNVIKLDIADVPQSAPINFVILIHNNKYYYYFVDSIKYINEDIYELLISMDSIQTYAFDFTIKKGVVTRESISRWINDNEINRNYIPENISEGEFINSHYEKQENEYFVQVLSTTDFPVPSSYSSITKDFEPGRMTSAPDDVRGISFAYNYLFYAPKIVHDSVTVSVYLNGVYAWSKVYTDNQFLAFYQEFYNRDSTKNIRLINCDYLKFITVTVTQSTGVTNIKFDIDTSYCNIKLAEVWYANISNIGPVLCIVSQTSKLYNLTYNGYINNELFVKNTSPYALFDVKYIPQLLDENYISILYGEKGKLSQVPLRMYKTTNFDFKSYYDFQSGCRAYACYEHNTDYDKYNTFVQALYGNDFTLFSSYWLNYEATHKSSLTDGYALAQTNNAINFLKGAVGSYTNSTYNISTNTSGTTQSMNTQYGYYQDFNSSYSSSKNFSQTITGYTPIGAMTNAISAGQNMYNTYKEREILKADLKASPDSMGNLTELMLNFTTNSIEDIYAIYQVRDIEACARYFEYNGYKVHRVVNGNYRYNEICNNRYYYNVIKMQDIDIEITCMIPNEIIGDIKARLINGLRIFKKIPSLNILNALIYDNIEN